MRRSILVLLALFLLFPNAGASGSTASAPYDHGSQVATSTGGVYGDTVVLTVPGSGFTTVTIRVQDAHSSRVAFDGCLNSDLTYASCGSFGHDATWKNAINSITITVPAGIPDGTDLHVRVDALYVDANTPDVAFATSGVVIATFS